MVSAAAPTPFESGDVNVMARRALKDEMPGWVARRFTRAMAKGVLQNELQKRGGLSVV